MKDRFAHWLQEGYNLLLSTAIVLLAASVLTFFGCGPAEPAKGCNCVAGDWNNTKCLCHECDCRPNHKCQYRCQCNVPVKGTKAIAKKHQERLNELKADLDELEKDIAK